MNEAVGDGRTVDGVVDKELDNRVNMTRYQRKRAGQKTKQKWVATSTYALISDQRSVSHWKGTACVTYSDGSYTKDNTRNVTWTNGLSIGGVLDVTAQSGWTRNTKLSWKFKAKTRLCGNSSNGPVQSWQVEAHKY